MNDMLDCIMVGHHDVPYSQFANLQKMWSKHSGAYTQVRNNSVLLDGKRLTYMDLLNRALSSATGHPSQLSAFEVPSLGACYLKSFLARRNLRTEVVNYFTTERERLRDMLQNARAVAVMTTYYVEAPPIVQVVRFIRENAPAATKIIVGGPYVYNLSRHHDRRKQATTIETIGADVYVADSQGEQTLARVLTAWRDGTDLTTIPNLTIRTGPRRIHSTERAVEDNNLNANIIDWNHFADQTFRYPIYMRTARSCPYACAFCSYPAMAGRHVLTDVNLVVQELSDLRNRGVRYIIFIDDTFNVPLPRFKQLLRAMIDREFGFRWISFLRCGNADEETFDLMERSGCIAVFLGIESADEGILRGMNKKATPDRYKRGIIELHRRGIATYSSFIIGYPGETKDSVLNTLRFIQDSPPTFYYLQLYYNDTAAPVANLAAEYGLKGEGYAWSHNSMDWQEASGWIDELHKQIRGSIHLPETGLSVWGIPYLLSKGFSIEQVKAFAAEASKMLVASLDDSPKDFSAIENRLQQIVAAA